MPLMLLLRFGVLVLLFARLASLACNLRQRFAGTTASILDRAYEYVVTRSKGRITALAVGIDVPDVACFVMRREKAYDRFAKWCGIAREWQTRDERFDRTIYILCDDALALDALSMHEPLRKVIEDLFAHPLVCALHCAYGKLWIDCDVGHVDTRDTADFSVVGTVVAQLRDQFEAARKLIGSLNLAHWASRRDLPFVREQILLAATSVLGALGLLCFLIQLPTQLPVTLSEHAIVQRATLTTVVLTVMMLLALWLFLGRSSRTHLVLLDILLVGASGGWLAATTWYDVQNRRLDQAFALDYVIPIHKYVTHGRHGDHFHIVVAHWPDPTIDRTVDVERDVYDQVESEQCAHFEYHHGAFGDPWLARISPASHC